MTRRKGEYGKSRLDREFPYQVIVPAGRCTDASGAIVESLCGNLAMGPRHHSLFHQDRWHLVYCFADAAHADLFREKFGGETFHPGARGHGRQPSSGHRSIWSAPRRLGSGMSEWLTRYT
jgi:hypothetical protein